MVLTKPDWFGAWLNVDFRQKLPHKCYVIDFVWDLEIANVRFYRDVLDFWPDENLGEFCANLNAEMWARFDNSNGEYNKTTSAFCL